MTSQNLPTEFAIVLGMHRSGTSALSNALAASGGSHGKWLQEIDEHNPRGYGENARLVLFHDEVLRSHETSWIDPRLPDEARFLSGFAAFCEGLESVLRLEFDGSRPAVIKDPRMCRLLPSWQAFLAKHATTVNYVLTIRHPVEVIASLSKRDGISREWGLLSWMQHTLLAERHTRLHRRHVTTYDGLLLEPVVECSRLLTFLDWSGDPAEGGAAIAPELRHTHFRSQEFDLTHPLTQDAMEIWRQSQLLYPAEGWAELDAIFERFKSAVACFPPEAASHHVVDQTKADRILAVERRLWEEFRLKMEITQNETVHRLERESRQRQTQMDSLSEDLSDAQRELRHVQRQLLDAESGQSALNEALEKSRTETKLARKEQKRLVETVKRWNERSWLKRAFHKLSVPSVSQPETPRDSGPAQRG